MMTGVLISLCILGTGLSRFGAVMPNDHLFMPIFIHFGVVHLVFNSLIIYRLGNCVEKEIGSRRAAMFMVATAIISNYAQHIWWPEVNFGGASGVLYALLGFAWVRGLVTKPTVGIALVWLVLGMTGLPGITANGCHVVGLLAGMVIAAVSDGWASVPEPSVVAS